MACRWPGLGSVGRRCGSTSDGLHAWWQGEAGREATRAHTGIVSMRESKAPADNEHTATTSPSTAWPGAQPCSLAQKEGARSRTACGTWARGCRPRHVPWSRCQTRRRQGRPHRRQHPSWQQPPQRCPTEGQPPLPPPASAPDARPRRCLHAPASHCQQKSRPRWSAGCPPRRHGTRHGRPCSAGEGVPPGTMVRRSAGLAPPQARRRRCTAFWSFQERVQHAAH